LELAFSKLLVCGDYQKSGGQKAESGRENERAGEFKHCYRPVYNFLHNCTGTSTLKEILDTADMNNSRGT